MADIAGAQIGRYQTLDQIGEGGMATVFKAFDTRLETEVAIKFIRTEKLTLETMSKSLKRFEREAKALAQLNHPNIVKVIDYGEYDGRPYLVMPYLKGGTLKQMLGKPLPYRKAAGLLAPIAHALEYAHQHNVLHRDVKPSNILLTDSGQPMLSDFGIAKILEDELTVDLTGTGVGVGTPEYMAPEQGMSHSIDHRVDVYSLGTVFYEMVTGRKPYQADTPLAILLKRASEPLPRPKQFVRELPDAVEYVLLKALAKNPDERYPTADAFATALENLARDQIPSAQRPQGTGIPPKWLWVGGTVVIACAIIIGLGVLLKGVMSGQGSEESPTSTPVRFTPDPYLNPTPMDATLAPLPVTEALIPTLPPPSPTVEPTPSVPVGKDGMEVIYVPEGEFTMGSNGGDDDEQPPHSVYLNGYWIDRTEVTNEMYARFLNEMGNQAEGGANWYDTSSSGALLKQSSGSWRPVSGYEDHPVAYVTWYGANAYCSWADRRLPTEAEWEKAARGPSGNTLPWGGSLDCSHANFGGCVNKTTEVKSYPLGGSPYGVYDMFGNVWEWVYDKYGTDYYKQSPYNDPTGSPDGKHHILRGAAWDTSDSKRLRITFRYNRTPALTSGSYGFRCAVSTRP